MCVCALHNVVVDKGQRVLIVDASTLPRVEAPVVVAQQSNSAVDAPPRPVAARRACIHLREAPLDALEAQAIDMLFRDAVFDVPKVDVAFVTSRDRPVARDASDTIVRHFKDCA